MLEEALRDPSKHPAEVAQAMLSFIRSDLPNGGASSEERFINLVQLLCTRVFGEMQGKDFKHEPGGWLSAQNRWRTPTTGRTTQQPQSYGRGAVTNRSVPSIDADPVVQLLGPVQAPATSSSNRTGNMNNKGQPRSLIETMSAEVESRPGVLYPFPFPGLPEPMQRQFLLVLEATAAAGNNQQNPHLGMGMGLGVHTGMAQTTQQQQQVSLSQNSQILFNSLRVRPELQDQVRLYQQKKHQARNQAQPLQLSPGLASPQSLAPASPSLSAPKTDQKENTPNLFLSMLEYYMFLFIRFPMAAPVIPRQSQSHASFGSYQITGTIQRRQETPYGERVYCTLFSRYLRHFLPHTQAPMNTGGVFSPEKSESEFFLRVIIAFWLECHGSLLTTAKAAQGIIERERFQRTVVSHSPLADLNMSYDLTIGKFDPPPTTTQICLRRLVVHVISDPTIQRSVMNPAPQQWCLSPAMTVLQQPFYNYIRSTFRHASIHSQSSVFYTALNAWLMWLEPWNVNHAGSKTQNAAKRIVSTVSGAAAQTTSAPTLTIPSADRKSTYTKVWEPYLAANLFLYTVPLAIFLRRARELDFSPREMQRSMRVVRRVFRVFTPEVVHALENITKSLNYPDQGLGATLPKVADHHRKNLLGDYAPSLSGNLSLSCCQGDMQGLLEEIQMQHMKRVRDLGVFDKAAAFLEGLFGHGVVSGEEMAIQSLVERAKTVVGLPIDYEVFSQDQSKMLSEKGIAGTAGSSTALRDSQGNLTDEGRRQLLNGSYKCSPTEIGFIGDRSKGRIRSHESPALVSLTVALSTWLNKKLGLLPPDSDDAGTAERFQKNLMDQSARKGFRIDLRWFADWRNLGFSIFCVLFAWKILL